MPTIDFRQTPGNIHRPCRLFDADGNEIYGRTQVANLDTGECLDLVTDANGAVVLDHATRGPKREKRTYKAPLVLIDAVGQRIVGETPDEPAIIPSKS